MHSEYIRKRKEFFQTANEQRKIEQILATPNDMWEMTKQIKRSMARHGQRHIELTGPQVRQFTQFWQGMYQDSHPPQLTSTNTEGQPPSRERIK